MGRIGTKPGSPYTALYLLSCVGVKGDLVVAGDDELTTQRRQSAERGHACIHKRGGKGRGVANDSTPNASSLPRHVHRMLLLSAPITASTLSGPSSRTKLTRRRKHLCMTQNRTFLGIDRLTQKEDSSDNLPCDTTIIAISTIYVSLLRIQYLG